MMHEFDSCSILVVQGTVHFLCVKCLSWQDNHHKINIVYDEHAIYHPGNCMSKQFVNRHWSDWKISFGKMFELHHSWKMEP